MSGSVPRRGLVLTAGLGTRLRPLTRARAKAAALVDGEALVRRVVRWLVAQGVADLVLNLHHKPESISAAVGDGSDLGARVRYSWESPILGSAGGPRRALPLLLDRATEETFALVNGDTLTTVDLAAMSAQHRSSGALVTMALIPNPRPDKYGGVLLDENGAVTAFTRRGSSARSFHFIGPQIVEAAAFADLPDGVPSESVLEIYPRLMAARRGSVMGFVSDAGFQDIGTPGDLLETSLAFAAADGRPDRPRWGADVCVSPKARVARSVLWDDVVVEDGASLSECVISDGVRIPAGAVYERAAIARADAEPAGAD
ncbi:MAG TPA: NDP-sugar synthase, partial [Vicinamibacterales bacterium]